MLKVKDLLEFTSLNNCYMTAGNCGEIPFMKILICLGSRLLE